MKNKFLKGINLFVLGLLIVSAGCRLPMAELEETAPAIAAPEARVTTGSVIVNSTQLPGMDAFMNIVNETNGYRVVLNVPVMKAFLLSLPSFEVENTSSKKITFKKVNDFYYQNGKFFLTFDINGSIKIPILGWVSFSGFIKLSFGLKLNIYSGRMVLHQLRLESMNINNVPGEVDSIIRGEINDDIRNIEFDVPHPIPAQYANFHFSLISVAYSGGNWIMRVKKENLYPPESFYINVLDPTNQNQLPFPFPGYLVTMNWKQVPKATRFEVWMKAPGQSAFTLFRDKNTNSENLGYQTFQYGTYEIKVRAKNNSSLGNFSNVATMRILFPTAPWLVMINVF